MDLEEQKERLSELTLEQRREKLMQEYHRKKKGGSKKQGVVGDVTLDQPETQAAASNQDSETGLMSFDFGAPTSKCCFHLQVKNV